MPAEKDHACVCAINGNLVFRNEHGTHDVWSEKSGWWAFGLEEWFARRLAEMYPASGDEQHKEKSDA